MLASLLVYAILLLPAVWGFGLTESGDSYIVDTEGGLIFTGKYVVSSSRHEHSEQLPFSVKRTSGDITSMKFNGVEAQGANRNSHIASGIGASCSWTRGGNSNNYIKITCATDSITQYYVARYKDPSIHMSTYTTAEPSVGELRFIARLMNSTVPNGIPAANVQGGTAIEAADIVGLADGQTRSKFYSSRQFIDDAVKGVTGSGIGVYMVVYGQGFESASGGPFFRDIDNRGGRFSDMNSGHTQTEPYRMGLHGPYALVFTTGAAPSANIDPLFWAALDIEGLVPQTGRGRVTGKASNFPSQFASLMTVGFNNSVAQYWARTDASGSFVSPYMKPGMYTMTLYKAELAVGSQNISVSAGGTTTSDIASSESNPSVIWQIGDFDGTPRGFLNADKIETMQ
ncbi:hypothetical protein PM082_023296 [Marasmius tenuissimus]|nr:hypothetical protein PM082_023296 [Marasmius tenuissimus]